MLGNYLEKNDKMSMEFNTKLADALMKQLVDKCRANAFVNFDAFKEASKVAIQQLQEGVRGPNVTVMSNDHGPNVIMIQFPFA